MPSKGAILVTGANGGLGSLSSVRKTAADINARVAKGGLPRIRAMILNAGYSGYANLVMSEDGIEMTWHVNFLFSLLLSLLLLQSMDAQDGRNLFISSWSHNKDDPRNGVMGMGAYNDTRYPTLFPGAETLAKGQWSSPKEDPGFSSGFRRYGASKLCAIMLCEELANRIAKDPKLNISVTSLDPRTMPTNFAPRAGFLIGVVATRTRMPMLSKISVRFSPNGILRPSWKSAADTIRACFEIEVHKGEALYLDGTAGFQIAKDARDGAKREELWEYGLLAAKIEEGDTALVNWR